jgi:hypothetical protein
LAPWSELREFSFRPITLYIQLLYWITINFFIVKYAAKINWHSFFKYLIIGLILQVIAFYAIHTFTLNIGPITILIANYKARNALMFQLIAISPIILAYFYKKPTLIFLAISLAIIASAMLSGGRAGSLIVSLITLLFWFRNIIFKPIVIFGLIVCMIFIKINITYINPFLESLSYVIEPYNFRLAYMLRGEAENTDLSEDRSLLERQLHITKGIEIFSKYPILGIGIGNYNNYALLSCAC